jgi:ribonuclease E
LAILRLIEEEALKERTAQIRTIVPMAVATFILNEKRDAISDIEKRHNVHVLVVPNPQMETPHYEVIRMRDDDENLVAGEPSYAIKFDEAPLETETVLETQAKPQEAAISNIQAPRPPAPEPESKPKAKVRPEKPATPGAMEKLGKWFKGLFESEPKPVKKPAPSKPKPRSNERPARNRNNQSTNRGKQTRNNQGNERRPNNRKQNDVVESKKPDVKVEEKPAKAAPRKNINRRPTRDAQTGRVSSDEVGQNRKTRGDSKNAAKRVKPKKPESTVSEIDFDLLGKKPVVEAKVEPTQQELEVTTNPVTESPAVEVKTENVSDSISAPSADLKSDKVTSSVEVVDSSDKSEDDSSTKTEDSQEATPLAKSPEPEVAQETIVTEKTEAPTKEETVDSEPTTPKKPVRAANDPREVKRRMQEAKNQE